MRKAVPALVGTVALASPWSTAFGATKAKIVTTTKRVTGSAAQADRWGAVQVALVVKKTTKTVGTKKTVTRKITSVTVPQYPNHTDRSVFINQQALPILEQEVLRAQFNANINFVSGATDTSDAFIQSLQAALIAAKKV